jgi:hypothetical protein
VVDSYPRQSDGSEVSPRLLQEIVQLRVAEVSLVKATEQWKAECTSLKMKARAYVEQLAEMEVQLADTQIDANALSQVVFGLLGILGEKEEELIVKMILSYFF